MVFVTLIFTHLTGGKGPAYSISSYPSSQEEENNKIHTTPCNDEVSDSFYSPAVFTVQPECFTIDELLINHNNKRQNTTTHKYQSNSQNSKTQWNRLNILTQANMVGITAVDQKTKTGIQS